MGKRGIIFLFSMLIIAPNAFSIYEEILFSDTVEDGDAVNISGKEFAFKIDPQSSKVYIEIDISGVIVESGECKIKDRFDICVNNVSFSYRNYDPWYDVYKAEVEVYQIKSKLDIAHTIEKENILIDEEVTGVLSFENTADVPVQNVTATMPIPPNLLFTEIEGCKQIGGVILFDHDVSPRQTRTCTYKAKSISPGNYELVANVSYFDGVETKTAVSGAIEGKVYNYSLAISYSTNKSRFDIGENFNMSIILENINDEHELSVTALSIKVPEKILVIKKPKEAAGNSRLLSWSGTLTPKEKKSLDFELKGLITGKYELYADGSYKISKFLREVHKSQTINVNCTCLHIEHDFSQNIVVAGQRAVLIADLVNPGPNEFRNVRISYAADVPGIEPHSSTYSSIRPGERIRVFSSSVIAPDFGAYYFNITANYQSSYQEVFTQKESIPIKVAGADETEEKKSLTEEKKAENVSLTSGETAGTPKEEEKEQEQKTREIPVTILQDEKKKPIMAYAIVAVILSLIVGFVFLRVLKRKKEDSEEKIEPVEKPEDITGKI
ncbi:hypothetical protein HYU09_00405 [Candidatus Woesearchaeota archaeon]|nr:hypothetical protein [Candidatus Woesearchaeota archaeon]